MSQSQILVIYEQRCSVMNTEKIQSSAKVQENSKISLILFLA